MRKNTFRFSNTILCIDFTKKVAAELNALDHEALNIVHIFAVNPDRIDADAIRAVSENARKRRIKVILHCFSEKDRNAIRKLLKGIKKDVWFHLNLMTRDIFFRPEPGHHVFVTLCNRWVQESYYEDTDRWEKVGYFSYNYLMDHNQEE